MWGVERVFGISRGEDRQEAGHECGPLFILFLPPSTQHLFFSYLYGGVVLGVHDTVCPGAVVVVVVVMVVGGMRGR